MKKYEIMFIEDKVRLHKDQLSYYHYSLEYFRKKANAKIDSTFHNVVNSVGELCEKTDCFVFQIDVKGEVVEVTVRSVLHPVKTKDEENDLLNVLQISKEKARLTLFVVDLNLDPDDPTDFKWGYEIAEQLEKSGITFLKMTGSVSYDNWSNYDFINRAVASDNVMVDDYPAAIPSPFYTYLEEKYPGEKDDCYQFLSYLLRSGYYNHQYVGGVLTKLIVSIILPDIGY